MRVLFMGFGKMARDHYLPKLAKGTEIYYHDPYVETDEYKHYKPGERSFDLCIITSLNSEHFANYNLVKKDCNRFIVEKPVVCNTKEYRELVNDDSIIYTGHILRQNPSTYWLKDFLTSINCADIKKIEVSAGNPYSWNRKVDFGNKNWLVNYGVLHDVGVHLLDILFWTFDATGQDSISDMISSYDKEGLNFKASCKFRNIPVRLRFSNQEFLPFEIRISINSDLVVWSPSNIIFRTYNKSFKPIFSSFYESHDSVLYHALLDKKDSPFILTDTYKCVTEFFDKHEKQ